MREGGSMKGFLDVISNLSKLMEIVSGVALSFIVLLTTADVVLRAFGHPILGTYEIVSIGGAVIIGFGLPVTSWEKFHIYVDFVIKGFSSKTKKGFDIVTRCIGIGVFLMIAWNVVRLGIRFQTTGEVTDTIQLPIYVIAYGLGFCFLILSLVLVCHILKIAGGSDE
jgi:TRAP-type C4-dicarboxylate transport system permease small subunit